MELKVEAPSSLSRNTIPLNCEVLKAEASQKPGRGIVKTLNKVINQNGQVLMSCAPVRLVKGYDRLEPGAAAAPQVGER